MQKTEVDLRRPLTLYIAHVIDCEGDDFIEMSCGPSQLIDKQMSREERDELRGIACEARAMALAGDGI